MTTTLLHTTNHIDGEWLPASTGPVRPIYDPASGDLIDLVNWSGATETSDAISAAVRAQPQWATTLSAKRSEILRAMAQIARANATEFAQLITRENGKPLTESHAEVQMSAAYLEWFAEECRRSAGTTLPSPWANRQIQTVLEPVGVVAAFTPWNFPSLMVARKAGAALAAGCAVIVKPSDLTPFSALAWAEIARRAGLPKGLLNVVIGDAESIGNALVDHPAVRKLTFTGSTRVGAQLSALWGGRVKRCTMELGGNAPAIVFADADIPRAVRAILDAKFRNAGQTCVSPNRIYVQDPVHDEFVAAFCAAVEKMVVGPGSKPETQIGPLINDAACQRIDALVADAGAKGARIELGGHRHPLGANFWMPTVLTGVHPEMALCHQEIFGPVAAFARFASEDEVLTLANATEAGLAAYVFTQDLGRALRMTGALKTGIVGVNEGLVTTEVAPFGGVKSSGFGREGGPGGLRDFQDEKYVCMGY
jgi:succinate-semialdehyde dehydrogenase/glutarate-semialdehyde dehydrogenase